ncbi:M61 family metallopeptidase [Synechococcus sp. PCC 7336]|uniref:M61 family metallopeptidase n=1 Tax=Synechococcus sp. PCC 7336 TaxID=195250 RepID=UPI000349CA38|nr:PDZ domain-containing protein [Synechococcus sp. PCC 7336]
MTFTSQDSAVVRATPISDRPLRQHYWVRMPEPANHLLEIELRLTDLLLDRPLQLVFPAWTPGSYLLREYARHLQELSIFDGADRLLEWTRLDKNTWEILPAKTDCARVCYRLYAHDLTVRTNHLDSTHGFFNGAASFLYCVGREREAIALTVCPPEPNWQIATALPPLNPESPAQPGQPQTFLAQDFDELVDSPVEVGLHRTAQFEVLDKPHRFVVWGKGNEDLDKIVAATQKIIETEAELFGGLPYDRYLFLLHLSSEGAGGLEHKCSTTLNYPRFGFVNPERYDRFLSLVAHEFFHLWNVKRLRPKAIETFDYGREAYLRCLWFCEGTTSYYDTLILRRGNLISVETYLKLMGDRIGKLQKTVGRQVQSLIDSSFDTWIKLYRPTENTSNSQVSYYLKGEIVSMLLDLAIRLKSQGKNSLDTVVRDLWQRFGQFEIGYTDTDLREAFESAATTSLTDFFANYIEGTAELEFDRFLDPFGLCWKAEVKPDSAPYLGMSVKANGNSTRIEKVAMGSPAQQAGIWAGDELLAIDGFKVTAKTLPERLKDYQPGQRVAIAVFQREELKLVEVTLGEPERNSFAIAPLPEATAEQRQRCIDWLGGYPEPDPVKTPAN